MSLPQRKVYATRSQTKLLRELQIQREGRQEAVNELQTLPKAASGSDKRVSTQSAARERQQPLASHVQHRYHAASQVEAA